MLNSNTQTESILSFHVIDTKYTIQKKQTIKTKCIMNQGLLYKKY